MITCRTILLHNPVLIFVEAHVSAQLYLSSSASGNSTSLHRFICHFRSNSVLYIALTQWWARCYQFTHLGYFLAPPFWKDFEVLQWGKYLLLSGGRYATATHIISESTSVEQRSFLQRCNTACLVRLLWRHWWWAQFCFVRCFSAGVEWLGQQKALWWDMKCAERWYDSLSRALYWHWTSASLFGFIFVCYV